MIVMTSDQYTELVAYLDRKFEEDQRHWTALFEQANENLRIVAEGMNARFGSLEKTVASVDEGVRRTLADHEVRIQALE